MKNNSLRDYIATIDERVILFDAPSYDASIIGLSHDGQHAIYDLDMMAYEYARDNGCSIDDAFDFISCNTLRACDYIDDEEHRPIIVDMSHDLREFWQPTPVEHIVKGLPPEGEQLLS